MLRPFADALGNESPVGLLRVPGFRFKGLLRALLWLLAAELVANGRCGLCANLPVDDDILL